MSALLDTNIIIYHLAGKLATPLDPSGYAISVMTEIELLSYPDIDQAMEERIQTVLSRTPIIEISDSVKAATIQLRRQYRLKIADAIIAATALVYDLDFVTNDMRLSRIDGLRLRTLPIEGSPSP